MYYEIIVEDGEVCITEATKSELEGALTLEADEGHNPEYVYETITSIPDAHISDWPSKARLIIKGEIVTPKIVPCDVEVRL